MAASLRDREAEDLRDRLLAESFPRLQMTVIVAIAGICAFLGSAALLASGLSSMAIRYFLAAGVGYLAFLTLIRAWIAFQRRRWEDLDADLLVDLPLRGAQGGAPAPEPFASGGGSFGGGGAGRSFDASDRSAGPYEPPALEGPEPGSPAAASSSIDLPDVDDAWPLVLAAAFVVAGLAALGLVVYASPILFAEVLLDAAVAGAVYRRARRRSRAHWLAGVLRRTWLPAVALCAFVAGTGLAVQAWMPEARSLGDAVRAVSAR
jgi:hypothetical protein